MDWTTGIQNAIDYIEDNLTSEPSKLSVANIASYAYSSEYHFQRVFSILTNLTVAEYIRNRRLSLAGEELILTNKKIIDIAMKYGYETPESFTKAFTRFHGFTPMSIRQNNGNLKSFNRLTIKLKLEGGTLLDYQISDRPNIQIVAKSRKFSTASLEENNREIPKFCIECYKDGVFDTILKMSSSAKNFPYAVLGLRDSGDCNSNGSELRYSIGCEYSGGIIPKGYSLIELPAQKWAVFKCKGEMPKAMQELWYQVYTEFMPFTTYHLIDNITLEVCPKGTENTLWIPISET